MSSLLTSPPLPPTARDRTRRARLRRVDLRANRFLIALTWVGAIAVVVVMAAVAFQIIQGASQAINRFGPLFAFHSTWVPSLNKLGGLSFLFGSLITSLVALVFATALGVSIGLFLALLAPRAVANVLGPLVEMLAAIPSVVMGLIGIIIISPFSAHTLEPVFHAVLGWTGLFGAPPQNGSSLFTASLVLTIMVLPIISSLTRDIFRTVPIELRDGAEALGATRWEMIRGIVLPTTVSGITGACVLGFARAMGEAIAVTQVVGNASLIHANLFLPGTTIASAIANQFESPQNNLTLSGLYYLALVLLVIGVLTNLLSRRVVAHGARLA
ncbi:MAG TPA: phosphate ABC transporter permease subunit PstC [Solirubrobacteraceae bacterium]|nr:phosphate ABC transporter permease subunit PstC [Solirubrobacteraceae bacterium]